MSPLARRRRGHTRQRPDAPHRPARLLPGVLALVLGAGCGGDAPEDLAAPPASAADDRPHIVLVVCDTLRADHLDLHGYARRTMPLLRGWASTALIYDNATAPSNWTRPSVQALFTGRHAEAGSVFEPGDLWPSDGPWLPEQLREAGYHTVGATANIFLGRDFGGDRGFDRYAHSAFDRAQPGHWKHLIASEGLLDQLETELRQPALPEGQPVFLYVHLMDPHIPYDPPSSFRDWCPPDYDGPFDGSGKSYRALRDSQVDARLTDADRSQIQGLYDGELRRMDGQLARLRKLVGRYLADRDVVTLVTADHGELFGEGSEGRYLHGSGMDQALLHVPLIVSGLGRSGRVNTRVGLVDIAPTLRALANADSLTNSGALIDGDRNDGDLRDGDGTDLRDARRGRDYVAYKALPGGGPFPGQVAVLRDDLKAVRLGETWTLERTSTGEDVTAAHPRQLRDMMRAANRWGRSSRERAATRQAAGPDVMTEEMAQRLAALGYVDEAAEEPERDTDGSDTGKADRDG